MEVKKMNQTLQAALKSKLGPGAPIYLLIDNELYDVGVSVLEKGDLGPGSVLLTKVPLKKRGS